MRISRRPRGSDPRDMKMKTSPWDPVDRLKTDEARAAYREAAVEFGDNELIAAVEAIAYNAYNLANIGSTLGVLPFLLVNGPDEVWIDRGDGLELADVRFDGSASVLRLAQRLATMAGRRLDEAAPFVDARLADGTRLHAVIPPIAASCSLISLRIPSHRGFRLDDVVAAGTIDEHGAEWLRAIVSARLAFLVSGGTGSGKTTLLSTLLEVVDPVHRILIVEDSAELRPLHPHVVRLEARPANLEGVGVVTLRDLVRQALRMRPDRVVVGEVRGAEVVDLLA